MASLRLEDIDEIDDIVDMIQLLRAHDIYRKGLKSLDEMKVLARRSLSKDKRVCPTVQVRQISVIRFASYHGRGPGRPTLLSLWMTAVCVLQDLTVSMWFSLHGTSRIAKKKWSRVVILLSVFMIARLSFLGSAFYTICIFLLKLALLFKSWQSYDWRRLPLARNIVTLKSKAQWLLKYGHVLPTNFSAHAPNVGTTKDSQVALGRWETFIRDYWKWGNITRRSPKVSDI